MTTAPITYTLPMQRDVAAFHDAFGSPNRISSPSPLPKDRIELRLGLIREEGVNELRDAAAEHDPVLVIDALIDTVYVALGALVEMGHDARGLMAHDRRRGHHRFDPERLVQSAAIQATMNEMFLTNLDQAFRLQDASRSAQTLEAIADDSLLRLSRSGVDHRPFFAEVQRANMSKLGSDGRPVISRGVELDGYPEGKVLKGANYVAPDLAGIYHRLYGTAAAR